MRGACWRSAPWRPGRSATGPPPAGAGPRALALAGLALFYGDGLITPAISVLAAVEGLETAAPALEPYVVPLAVARAPGLFLIQSRGTASVGALFGPVMLVWFATLGLLGLAQIVQNPARARGARPALRLGPVRARRLAGLRRPGRRRAGGHRGGGALRRHGPLRPHGRSASPGSAGAAGAGAQLFRPGRAGPARARRRSSTRSTTWPRAGCSGR